jgi:hypothetical protein
MTWSNCCDCGVGSPLPQAQQGQAGLWDPAAPARVAVSLLGPGKVALEAKNLPLAIGGLSGGRFVRPLGEALARQPRLVQRGRPLPA